MRVAFLIAILLLALMGAKSQGYHYSPKYYPIQASDMQVSQFTKSLKSDVSELEYGTALPSFWQKHKKGLLITTIQICSVVADAAGDAVYDMGKESSNDSQMFWGHSLQAIGIGGMGISVASLSWRGNAWDGVKFGVGWLSMRYALHDLTYNITRGIGPLYADGVKAKMEPTGIVITQSLAFVFSVSWNIKEF